MSPVPTGLLVGRAAPFGPNGEPSAIDKRPVDAPLRLGVTGFEGDEVADRHHHGGPDKAVHHYAAEHYAAWRAELPGSVARLRPGGFGENLSTEGLTEHDVCVGDVYRLGTALLAVSQARQPCWKLDVRFGVPGLARRVQQTGRTGWYHRVLEPGQVAPGDALRLVDRPHPDWTIARLVRLLYVDPLDADALAAVEALDVLPASWRALAAARRATGRVEDWTRRLEGPLRP